MKIVYDAGGSKMTKNVPVPTINPIALRSPTMTF